MGASGTQQVSRGSGGITYQQLWREDGFLASSPLAQSGASVGCCGFLAAAGARALAGPGHWPHMTQTGIATPSCGPPGPEPLTRTGPGADGSALHLMDCARGRAGPHVPTSTPGHLGAHIRGFRGSTPPGLWAGTGWRGRLQRPGEEPFPCPWGWSRERGREGVVRPQEAQTGD